MILQIISRGSIFRVGHQNMEEEATEDVHGWYRSLLAMQVFHFRNCTINYVQMRMFVKLHIGMYVVEQTFSAFLQSYVCEIVSFKGCGGVSSPLKRYTHSVWLFLVRYETKLIAQWITELVSN